MTAQMSFIVDDDVSLVGLLETLHAAGLTISSIDGFRFRFLRSLVRRKPKPGRAGESAKPKLLHKSLTLRRSYGPGSLAEHDHLVAVVGAVGARDVEKRGPAHIAACLADPWKYQNEPAGRPR